MSSPVKNINAADFRRICAAARRFVDETGVTRLLLGPLDEWGEGSIGYPNRELGFGQPSAGFSPNVSRTDSSIPKPSSRFG